MVFILRDSITQEQDINEICSHHLVASARRVLKESKPKSNILVHRQLSDANSVRTQKKQTKRRKQKK